LIEHGTPLWNGNKGIERMDSLATRGSGRKILPAVRKNSYFCHSERSEESLCSVFSEQNLQRDSSLRSE
jgi:hypothetical protein